MRNYGWFYGFEVGFGISRLYKIFVTEAALCGAKIGSKDYEGGLALNRAMGRSAPLVEAEWERSKQKEKEMDAIGPDSPQFLNADKANFSLGPAQIASATLSLKTDGFVNSPNRFGTLTLTLSDGRKRRFFLIGTGRAQEVTELLQKFLPSIEIVSADSKVAGDKGQAWGNSGDSTTEKAPSIASKPSGQDKSQAVNLLAFLLGSAASVALLGVVVSRGGGLHPFWQMLTSANSAPYWIVMALVIFRLYHLGRRLWLTLNLSQNAEKQLNLIQEEKADEHTPR